MTGPTYLQKLAKSNSVEDENTARQLWGVIEKQKTIVLTWRVKDLFVLIVYLGSVVMLFCPLTVSGVSTQRSVKMFL